MESQLQYCAELAALLFSEEEAELIRRAGARGAKRGGLHYSTPASLPGRAASTAA